VELPESDPDGDQFKLEELRAADVLLLGRVTYQGFATYGPANAKPDQADEEPAS